jgi:hypothetical protein
LEPGTGAADPSLLARYLADCLRGHCDRSLVSVEAVNDRQDVRALLVPRNDDEMATAHFRHKGMVNFLRGRDVGKISPRHDPER